MTPRTSTSNTSLKSSVSVNDEQTPIRLGFIGCGTIAVAIATGCLTQNSVPVLSVAVSRRSAKQSAALQAKFKDSVTVYDNNQNLIDNADVIFLCVLPQHATEVLQGLQFDPDRHSLVSLVSTASLASLQAASGLTAVWRMICLPAVATHQGVCLVTPSPSPTLNGIFQALGGVAVAPTESQMHTMMVPTGMMGSLYALLRQNRDYLVREANLDSATATAWVTRLYQGMLHDVVQRLDDDDPKQNAKLLDEMVAEQTPGGLNEQGIRQLTQAGVWEAYDSVSDGLLERIRKGQSQSSTDGDGSKDH
jgi:pyrroline-5-carboxylate reductase